MEKTEQKPINFKQNLMYTRRQSECIFISGYKLGLYSKMQE